MPINLKQCPMKTLVSWIVILVWFPICVPQARASTHGTVPKVSIVANTIARVILGVLQPGEENEQFPN